MPTIFGPEPEPGPEAPLAVFGAVVVAVPATTLLALGAEREAWMERKAALIVSSASPRSSQ